MARLPQSQIAAELKPGDGSGRVSARTCTRVLRAGSAQNERAECAATPSGSWFKGIDVIHGPTSGRGERYRAATGAVPLHRDCPRSFAAVPPLASADDVLIGAAVFRIWSSMCGPLRGSQRRGPYSADSGRPDVIDGRGRAARRSRQDLRPRVLWMRERSCRGQRGRSERAGAHPGRPQASRGQRLTRRNSGCDCPAPINVNLSAHRRDKLRVEIDGSGHDRGRPVETV